VYVTVTAPFSSKRIAQSKRILIFCGVSEYSHVCLEVGLLFCISVHVKVHKVLVAELSIGMLSSVDDDSILLD